MLSSRHDMAVRHKLKPNQNSSMNKSEDRFLAEDTLRAEGCWRMESHSSSMVTGRHYRTNGWPTPMPTWMELTGLSELLLFRTWNWKGDKIESGLSKLGGEGSISDRGITLSKTQHKYYLSKGKKSKESTTVLLLVPTFLSQALFRITFFVQDFCWTQEKENMLIPSSWKHILQS